MFDVVWYERARNDLLVVSRDKALKIEKKVSEYLAKAPDKLGKQLIGEYKGLYSYRYGDYRILYEVDLLNRVISISKIGHRKGVYED